MTQMTLWSSLFIIFSLPLALVWFAARQNPKLIIMIVSRWDGARGRVREREGTACVLLKRRFCGSMRFEPYHT